MFPVMHKNKPGLRKMGKTQWLFFPVLSLKECVFKKKFLKPIFIAQK